MKTGAGNSFLMFVGLLGCLSSTARAELALPMKYWTSSQGVKYEGARVMVGVTPRANPDGSFAVEESNLLYVAPHEAKITAAATQIYPTANCGVVANELANELTVSDLLKWNTDQIAEYKPYLSDLMTESRESSKQCLDAMKNRLPDAKAICDYASEVRKQVRELGEMISPWEKNIADIADQVQKRLLQLGNEPGGYVAVTANLYKSDEIEKVKNANPGFGVTVVPLKKVVFSFLPAQDDIDSSIPKRTTLGFALAGEPLFAAGEGGSPAALTQLKTGATAALGVTLSRLGACDNKLVRNGQFFYTFDSYGYLKGSVRYNQWQVYTRMEQTTVSGGFFTTKSVHELHEDMKSEQSFKFAVETDGGIDAETMKERLRGELLQQLLLQWSNLQALSDGKAKLSLPAPGQNGADVAGDALLKCPNVYCMVGGFALKTLSAIFGRSVTRDEAERTMNVDINQNWGYTTRIEDSDSATALIEAQF